MRQISTDTGPRGRNQRNFRTGLQAKIISREDPECRQTGDTNFQEKVNIAAEAA